MQSGKAVWPWVLGGVLVAGAVGGWLFRDELRALHQEPVARVEPAGSGAATDPPAAAAQPPAPPAIQHPLDAGLAADPALPALGDSDASAWEALADVFPGDPVLALFLRDHLIQRLVTHVDNLTRPSVPPTALALRPLPGTLQVDSDEAGDRIGAANAARYAPYVKAFTAVDAGVLAAAYVRFHPLIQEAYVELGHPHGYFNDRLVVVIDHLLQAPEPARPLAVERDERGRYRFVDPELQALSVGQKAMLRLDAGQAAAVKQQLRALRVAITRG